MINLFRFMFRKKLEKNNFFEGVSFEDNDHTDIVALRNDILDYSYFLYAYCGIILKSFKNLLPDFIVGNVMLSGAIGFVDITDEKSNTYIFHYNSPSLYILLSSSGELSKDYYLKLCEFSLIQESNILSSYNYNILDSGIMLDHVTLLSEDSDTLETSYSVEFDYHSIYRVEASLQNRSSIITINYTNLKIDFSDSFLNYISENSTTYDILPLCKKILFRARKEDTILIRSMVKMFDEELLVSRIRVENGEVLSYFYSEPHEGKSFTLKEDNKCKSISDILKNKHNNL